jgi:hypothetical protein
MQPAAPQQVAMHEKATLASEKGSLAPAKTSQLMTISSPVSQREAVRVSAGTSESQATIKPISLPTAKSQKSSFSKGKEVSCTPNVVRPGDTLVIKTSTGYPAFGVHVPDKNVKFLLLVSDAYPEGLMDNRKFSQQMGIDISVTEAKIKPNTRIFTKEGTYGFVVSQNLETDDGTPTYECKVRYSTR